MSKQPFLSTVTILSVLLIGWWMPPRLLAAETTAGIAFFEQRVLPLLREHCLECHSASSESVGGNLRLDHRAGWMAGGDLGPAIVPGDPQQSLLIRAVRRTSDALQMPPDYPLTPGEVRTLVSWIAGGAADPRQAEAAPTKSPPADSAADFWAFQSPHNRPITLPPVRDQQWPRNEVDYFVLAELEKNQLTPAVPASRRDLLRRATFDLTGLPPTREEMNRFLTDTAPGSFARVVDRLLASPRYGERWGRFWLDVARYADSNGLDENIAYGNAWRYRDYVIRAFNQDKPYADFVAEQLAGDLLPARSADDVDRYIATGFLSLGPKVLAEVDETKMEMDIVDEQVDTVGRSLLGLTLGCARCHDHKFDPIRTEDYYALAGIFKSTKTMEHFTKIARWHERVIASTQVQQRHAQLSRELASTKEKLEQLEAACEGEVDEAAGQPAEPDTEQHIAQLRRHLQQLEAEIPVLETAMAVTDYGEPGDLAVHVRGNYLTQGDVVARGFPAVLVKRHPANESIPGRESGRLQLARWLVDGSHPLTARVMVNRLWRWHFGQGLVATPDNFGQLGARPQNQPLLDWLARRFVADGWSIKSMHRRIMLSATYQMSTADNADATAVDPDNRLQWRAHVRRLEAEAIRDSLLAVSGLLREAPQGSLLHVNNREFLFDHTSIDKTRYDRTVRSVYLPVIRNHLYDGFQLFDYADASVVNGDRTSTVVAPQALFLMNSQLVREAAWALAERIVREERSPAARINFAYQVAFGRPVTDRELELANDYLASVLARDAQDDRGGVRAWALWCQTLLMSNEFIYIR